jgi:hypothetical protein
VLDVGGETAADVTQFLSAMELKIAASNGRAAGFKTTGE